ncbi:phosphotransferase [Paraferrimonas sp. SM1919]|uniref:phosphotransferase n=1 Tax=Paraferrimonas sp. SM1919 TaxID=2662263 RepID=UPI0013D0A614|nr:phosphotransferase [Paraferrimonas sp. SM1919]
MSLSPVSLLNVCLKRAKLPELNNYKPLNSGISQQSYWVNTAKGQYVIKCFIKASWPWLDWSQEWQIFDKLASAGVAPKLIYMDNHFAITAYVNHTKPSYQQLVHPLQKLHSLTACRVLNITAQTQAYLKHIASSFKWANASLINDLAYIISKFESEPHVYGLCHLDLHLDNALATENGCLLIDFEYAAMAPIILDLVKIKRSWQLEGAEFEELLEQFQFRPSLEQLRVAEKISIYLDWLWYAMEHQTYSNEIQQLQLDLKTL